MSPLMYAPAYEADTLPTELWRVLYSQEEYVSFLDYALKTQ